MSPFTELVYDDLKAHVGSLRTSAKIVESVRARNPFNVVTPQVVGRALRTLTPKIDVATVGTVRTYTRLYGIVS